jgi:hypothetical protein
MPLSPGERALFVSLWIILLLSVGIWKFWPHESVVKLMDDPKITVSDELKSVVLSAELHGAVPSRYQISITLTADFYQKFKDAHQPVRIGYDLRRDDSGFGGGVTVLNPSTSARSILNLSNPQLVSAKEIRLYLAH